MWVKSRDKVGDVEKDDGVFVEVLLEGRVLRNLQVGEEAAGIDGVVVVGAEHLCRHRLAEAAAAGDATATPFRE